MANPRQNEKNATIRISLASGDASNPLPDLTTATSIDFYIMPTSAMNSPVHVSGNATDAATVQFSTGTTSPFSLATEYTVEVVATWPDGGTSKAVLPIEVGIAPV